jgi:hypothetical protein
MTPRLIADPPALGKFSMLTATGCPIAAAS